MADRSGSRIERDIYPVDVISAVESPGRFRQPGGAPGGPQGVRSELVNDRGALTRLPASFVPPPEAIDFRAGGNNSVTGPATTAAIANSAVNIPRGTVGYIRSVTFNINNMIATTVVSFSVLLNGAPISGWNNISIFPRVAASVSVSFTPDETFIKISDGGTISLQVTVTDGGTYVLGGNFHGWHFSKRVAQDYGIGG